MRSDEITLGADPEIFIEHGNDNVLYAFSFLPDKYNPLRTIEENQGFYADGFQCEYNILPSTNIVKCLDSMRYGMKALLNAAKKQDTAAHFSTRTVIEVPIKELQHLPNDVLEFGCMPSFSAYNIAGMGIDGRLCDFRFAGGHIHFGIGQQPEELMNTIVKTLDAIVGIVGVSLFDNYDNPVRRKYYGLAGEYRLPPHGLEYRTLSTAWTFNPKSAYMFLDLARKVVAYVMSGQNQWQATEEEVIESILTCNVDMAREILARNNHCFEQIGFSTKIDLMRPIEESIPTFDNITENWGI